MSKVRGRVKDAYRKPYHERPRSNGCDDHLLECQFPSTIVEVISSEEEINDDEESVQTLESDMPNELIGFESWLQSADGGKLDQKTSRQHTKQVFKLLDVIDKKHELLSLFNDRLINDSFLEGNASKAYTPKTTQSYLMSLRHFYSFSLTGDVDVSISKEKIISLKDKVARWSSSYRVESSKRHWEKMTQDFEALITPEQIGEFEKSKASRDAICLLGQLAGAHNVVITQAQYTLIRDFLLVEISIDNANRAGSLANMTLGEFNSMTKENDEHVVLVKKSKMLPTHGPARIVLSARLQSWMKIYVQEVRSQVPGLNDGPDNKLFLSFNGEPMASSQINKAIKSIWKKAELEGSPNSTLFRKSAVSSVHSSNKSNETREQLADLMAHNISTAKKYYRLKEKSKSSVLASKQLRQVMRQDANDERLSPANQVDGETPKGHGSKQLPQAKRDDANDDSSSHCSPVEREKAKAPRNKEMEVLVTNLFQEEIKNQAVSMDIVRAKISCNELLQNEEPIRILDKVRAQWRFSTSQKETRTEAVNDINLPSEQETLQQRVQRTLEDSENTSDIIPPTVTSSVKNVFASTELEKVRNTFKEMIVKSAAIMKTRVKEILEKESWGMDVLKKASLETVVNRIKYERRVYRGKKV